MPQRLFFRAILLLTIFSIDLSSSTEEGIYHFLFTNVSIWTRKKVKNVARRLELFLSQVFVWWLNREMVFQEPNTTQQSIVKILFANSKIFITSKCDRLFINCYVTDKKFFFPSWVQVRWWKERGCSVMDSHRATVLSHGKSLVYFLRSRVSRNYFSGGHSSRDNDADQITAVHHSLCW